MVRNMRVLEASLNEKRSEARTRILLINRMRRQSRVSRVGEFQESVEDQKSINGGVQETAKDALGIEAITLN